MKKKISIFFTLISSLILFSQNYSEEDIFAQTKNLQLIIKPTIDKNIRAKIQPDINAEIKNLIKNPKDQYSKLDDKQIEFIRDTLTINKYRAEYNNYSAAGTTLGMVMGDSFYNTEYDKLLNKYYKEALELLQPEMKKQLIISQRKWLEYYTSETKFIYNLQDFGNQNSSLYASGYINEILVSRVKFLVDIYEEKMQGSSTYKEK